MDFHSNIVNNKDLDHIFRWRKKTIPYKRIPLRTKKELLEEFSKNPYPQKEALEEIAKRLKISLSQIQNWFKYQRKNEFISNKNKILKNYRRKHKFDKNEKNVLEKAFREKNHLDDDTLIALEKKLRCKGVFIKRWFYYRNQKLRDLEEIRKEQEKSMNIDSKNSTSTSESCKCVKKEYPTEINQNNCFNVKGFNSFPNTFNTMPLVNASIIQQNFPTNYAFINRMYGEMNMPPVVTPQFNNVLYLQNQSYWNNYSALNVPYQYSLNPFMPKQCIKTIPNMSLLQNNLFKNTF